MSVYLLTYEKVSTAKAFPCIVEPATMKRVRSVPNRLMAQRGRADV